MTLLQKQVGELTRLLEELQAKHFQPVASTVPSVSELNQVERRMLRLAESELGRKRASEFLQPYGAIKAVQRRWPKMGLLAFYEKLANTSLEAPVWPWVAVQQELAACLSQQGRRKRDSGVEVWEISTAESDGYFLTGHYQKAERLKQLAELLVTDWPSFPAPRTLGRKWPQFPPPVSHLRQWVDFNGPYATAPVGEDQPWHTFPAMVPQLLHPGIVAAFAKAEPKEQFFLGYLAVVDLHRRNAAWVERYGEHFIVAALFLSRYGNPDWSKRLQKTLPPWFDSPEDVWRLQEKYGDRMAQRRHRAKKPLRKS